MANVAEAHAQASMPAPAGASKKTILMVVAALVVLVAAGAVAFFALRGGKDPAAPTEKEPAASAATSESHGGKAGAATADVGALYDLDSFIVNLADSPEVRYLKLTVKLELDRPEVSADLVARVPQIRDAILILLSSKDSISLRTTQGKFQLRDEITHRVNTALPRGGVRTVYFTEFVVQ